MNKPHTHTTNLLYYLRIGCRYVYIHYFYDVIYFPGDQARNRRPDQQQKRRLSDFRYYSEATEYFLRQQMTLLNNPALDRINSVKSWD